MDLWIRTQDEEAIRRASHIKIEIHNKEEYAIVEQATILGKYKTRERAKQVINEIEEILKPKGVLKFKELYKSEHIKKIAEKNPGFMVANADIDYIQIPDTYLYKMPKE